MFLPSLEVWGGLFPIAALLASITFLVLFGNWSARGASERGNAAMRLPSVIFWLTAVPVAVGIVFLALVVILPLIFAALTGGVWPGTARI